MAQVEKLLEAGADVTLATSPLRGAGKDVEADKLEAAARSRREDHKDL